MMKPTAAGLAFALVYATGAHAGWLYQELGSAFDEQKTHVAMGMARNYALGLRCTGPADPEVIFVTPEDLGDADLASINMIGTKLLLRVDENPPLKVDGQIEATEQGFRIIAPAPDGLFAQVREAKNGVSAAIEMVGQVMHEQKFDVAGSTKAVQQMESACKGQ